jgi:hypothetical protein
MRCGEAWDHAEHVRGNMCIISIRKILRKQIIRCHHDSKNHQDSQN